MPVLRAVWHSAFMSASKDYTIHMPPAEKAPLHTGNIASWIWYFLLPYRATIIGFMGFRVARYTWIFMFPPLMGYLIDALNSGAVMADPGYYAGILIGFSLVYAICMLNILFTPEVDAYERANRALTIFSINHLNALSLNWHEAQGSGGKLQRVMTGRRSYQELTRHIRWDVVPLVGSILAIGVTYAVTPIPVLYALFFAGFIVSYLFAGWYFGLPFLALYDQYHEKFEKLLSGVYEFVSAIRTVKAFDLGETIHRKAMALEEDNQAAIMRTYVCNLMRWTICNLIAAVWLFVFAWVGFHDVLDGHISTGAYASIFFLAWSIWGTTEVVTSVWEKMYEYGNGISRLVETLREQPKPLDLEPACPLPVDWDAITWDEVNFSYSTLEAQGLRDISFTIKRGEKIAVVGPSGSGKSTLVKLLMKQMLCSGGEIRIGGENLAHIPSSDWLAQIGFVPQDVELFNMSVRDNILMERTDIDKDTYRTALQQSAILEFIDSLPEGDATMVGERGIKLSGGQRQRLGIARALVRQADLIIFDEATSSLDTLSEQQIQEAIETAFTGHTLVIIAHRLSTIKHVDRIIVLDQGRVAEQGSFEELLAQKGLFHSFWTRQSDVEL